MAGRGFPPEPTALKIVKGHAGRKRLPSTVEPTLPALTAVPPAPDWLTGAGQAVWRRTAEVLIAAHILTPLDLPALEIYAETYERWQRARRVRPADARAIKATTEAAGQLRLIANELGLSPTGRARLRITPPPPKSKLELFKERHGGPLHEENEP
jgi:phage terminase small subunit